MALLTSRRMLAALGGAAALAVLGQVAGAANQAHPSDELGETRVALAAAEAALHDAETRAAALAAAAAASTAAADRTARTAAALAGAIQRDEAAASLGEARLAMLRQRHQLVREVLARQQQPLVALTATLERVARHPLVFALARGDRLTDTVHVRAVIAAMTPVLDVRSRALRRILAQDRALASAALAETSNLRLNQAQLGTAQRDLGALEQRQRLDSHHDAAVATSAADRALALGTSARDLGALVTRLGGDQARLNALAALPAPPAGADSKADSRTGAAANAAGGDWILPVTGRIVSGFGEHGPGGAARGLTFVTRSTAQVIAPAAGRVAFAGPWRGYGQIVIIAHPGDWTSVVAGMARLSVAEGDSVVQGAPLGTTGESDNGAGTAGQPRVLVELRHGATPVDPLDRPGWGAR